jgi:hypothetical protein
MRFVSCYTLRRLLLLCGLTFELTRPGSTQAGSFRLRSRPGSARATARLAGASAKAVRTRLEAGLERPAVHPTAFWLQALQFGEIEE